MSCLHRKLLYKLKRIYQTADFVGLIKRPIAFTAAITDLNYLSQNQNLVTSAVCLTLSHFRIYSTVRDYFCLIGIAFMHHAPKSLTELLQLKIQLRLVSRLFLFILTLHLSKVPFYIKWLEPHTNRCNTNLTIAQIKAHIKYLMIIIQQAIILIGLGFWRYSVTLSLLLLNYVIL